MAGALAPNFVNQTMWTKDSLEVLRALNSDSIDLVYADPPFNSNKNYETRIGRPPKRHSALTGAPPARVAAPGKGGTKGRQAWSSDVRTLPWRAGFQKGGVSLW